MLKPNLRHCEPKAKQSILKIAALRILDCFGVPRNDARFWLVLTLIVVILDYFTKQFALDHLTLHQAFPVVPGLNFTLVYNTGAAFGFLNGAQMTWVLAAISLVASVLFLIWLRQAKHALQRCAIALLTGGALGNLIDRAFYGKVIDFVDLYIGEYHWPAFNVADAAICVGVGLLLVYWVKYERHS
jgi:signal peptidase II